MANTTENFHYNLQLETQAKGDASRAGLAASLEQLTVDGWKPIAFTSRLLNFCDKKKTMSTN